MNYKQCKTLFESLKKESKENYYPDFIDSDKYNKKETRHIMKETFGIKRVTNSRLPNFITVKEREILNKKETEETYNSYFVNFGPSLVDSIAESKTSSQNYDRHYDGPSYHQSSGFTTGKWILEPQNKQKLCVWWYICGCCRKSVQWNICFPETYFQYIFSKGSLLRWI